MDPRYRVRFNGTTYEVIDSVSETVVTAFSEEKHAEAEAKRLNEKYGWGEKKP